ncbi:MAG: hypothetical protein QF535_21925 [Anaerolineales bacterium]|nr:hypothetical protein [Anaerolineales bacterium]
MSTIKSSAEDLTINADGSNEIKFQINAVEKASIDSSGAFTSTTIDATALTGNLPALSGASLTALNATNLGSGTVPTARLGTGTASSGTFLRGDGAWQAAGGNLKIITALTHNNGGSAITESSGNNKTTGSGFNITTGSETNRVVFWISYFAMTYDSNGPAPYGHTSAYFHDSMTNDETPTGSVITNESSYFGGSFVTGSTARHDIYHNNVMIGIATVSASTEYFIQLCARRGQYGNYININHTQGFIMEYSQ